MTTSGNDALGWVVATVCLACAVLQFCLTTAGALR